MADLERIQAELLSPEPREVVEKRIKSTVIRRRAIRPAVEEGSPEEGAAAPQAKEEPPAVETPHAEAAPVEPVPKIAPKEVPVRTSIYREPPVGGVISRPAAPPEPPPRPVSAKGTAPKPAPAPVEPEAKTAVAVPEAPAEEKGKPAKKPVSETIQKAPEPEMKPLSIQPPPVREAKRPSAEQEKAHQAPPKAPRPAPGGRKEFPARPDLKIVKDIGKAVPPRPEKPDRQPEAERPRKKGAKAPVEVLMGEAPPRKKAFIKKLIDRKGRQIDVERPERPTKWREEKKAAPVKMQKTLITTPKAIKRRIRVDEAISVGEMAKRMGVKASEVINKLIGLGLMVTINQSIDCDTATLIAADFGYQVEAAQNERDETVQRIETSPGESEAPGAGRDDHGSRGSRQDVAPGCDPADERDRRRGGRDHPGHRRLPCPPQGKGYRLSGYAGS